MGGLRHRTAGSAGDVTTAPALGAPCPAPPGRPLVPVCCAPGPPDGRQSPRPVVRDRWSSPYCPLDGHAGGRSSDATPRPRRRPRPAPAPGRHGQPSRAGNPEPAPQPGVVDEPSAVPSRRWLSARTITRETRVGWRTQAAGLMATLVLHLVVVLTLARRLAPAAGRCAGGVMTGGAPAGRPSGARARPDDHDSHCGHCRAGGVGVLGRTVAGGADQPGATRPRLDRAGLRPDPAPRRPARRAAPAAA